MTCFIFAQIHYKDLDKVADLACLEDLKWVSSFCFVLYFFSCVPFSRWRVEEQFPCVVDRLPYFLDSVDEYRAHLDMIALENGIP